MKLSHIASAFFAVTGTILMAAAICLCLFFRNTEPQAAELPQGAQDCAAALVSSLNTGDFQSAGDLIWGQPDLGLSQRENDAAAPVWDAFLDSITLTPSKEPYADGSAFYLDATLTTLDIPSVTEALPGQAQAALEQRIATEADPAILYSESGELLPQVLSSALQEALDISLSQSKTLTTQGRIRLTQQDGHWWAIPDSSLMKALSGGLN